MLGRKIQSIIFLLLKSAFFRSVKTTIKIKSISRISKTTCLRITNKNGQQIAGRNGKIRSLPFHTHIMMLGLWRNFTSLPLFPNVPLERTWWHPENPFRWRDWGFRFSAVRNTFLATGSIVFGLVRMPRVRNFLQHRFYLRRQQFFMHFNVIGMHWKSLCFTMRHQHWV